MHVRCVLKEKFAGFSFLFVCCCNICTYIIYIFKLKPQKNNQERKNVNLLNEDDSSV